MYKILSELKPVFTENQFERLSNIFDSAGQVLFGVGVVAPIVSGFDRINLIVVISVLMLTAGLWATSIWLAKKG